jgi:hypothetical protein
MSKPSYSLDSTARKDANQHSAEESPDAPACYEPGRHCAYNQTRERFLSADVDAADFTTANLITRLPAITSDSGAGLWMVPFRGIAPTSVRVPVDLLYLDINCKVIETVESFPLARVSASAANSASVVVLPAESISSTETRAGDQLILCPPEEMKRRLQKLAEAPQEAAPAPAKEEPARNATGRVLQMEDRVRPRNAGEKPLDLAPAEDRIADRIAESVANRIADRIEAPVVEPAIQPVAQLTVYEPVRESAEPAPLAAPIQEAPAKPVKQGKSWLQRVLGLEPPDPRKAHRESLEGLSAYFFTGGTPVAHSVRDISLTGLYVLTSERWYPGTMVRMTLTDRHEPTVERSITLHATVMRAGDDGVGLRFVLQNPKDRRRPSDGTAENTDMAQVEQFIQRLRNS